MIPPFEKMSDANNIKLNKYNQMNGLMINFKKAEIKFSSSLLLTAKYTVPIKSVRISDQPNNL